MSQPQTQSVPATDPPSPVSDEKWPDVLERAAEAVRRKWADSPEADGPELGEQLSILLRLAESRRRDEGNGSLEGQATALRLRLLDEMRRVVLGSRSSSGEAEDLRETLDALRSLETLQEELEEDWARRFGLSLAGHRGVDMAAEIAHGLRSSCTSLLFAAEVLREGMYGELNPKQQQHVDILYGGALGLGAGLGDITELSWRTQEIGDGDAGSFSIEETVEGLRQLLRPVAEAKATELTLSVHVEPRRTGHARAFRQALLHLTLSALVTADGGRVTVSVRDGDGPDAVRVAIEISLGGDRPPEPEDEPFRILRERVDCEDYSFSTAGLRLHMGRELVRSLGSDLRYETAGDGSVSMGFSIPLPPAGAR